MIITRELCAKLVICVLLLGDGGSAKGIRKGNPRRGGSPNHLSSENLSHRVHCKPCRQIQTLGQGITSLSTLFMQCVCVDRPGDFPVALVVKNTSANAGDIRASGKLPTQTCSVCSQSRVESQEFTLKLLSILGTSCNLPQTSSVYRTKGHKLA